MGRIDSSGGGDEDGNTTESEEDETEQGFRLLFGGIEASDVTCDAWENESVDTKEEVSGGSSTSTPLDGVGVTITGATTTCTIKAPATNEPFDRRCNEVSHLAGSRGGVVRVKCADGTSPADSLIFAWAHSSTDDREATGRPPVQVVEFDGRGRGLIATRRLSRGTVLFTERAVLACQVPVDTDHGRPYSVRACQHCFRSLEPCLDGLPLPHLWPVPPMTDGLAGPTGNRPLSLAYPDAGTRVIDGCGRVVCGGCDACFCTQCCYNLHVQEQGSCCLCLRAARMLPELFGDRAVQSAVALSVRMFGSRLHQFRTVDATQTATCINGLCGLASDLTALELGVEVDGAYTLKPLYDCLCALWSMTDTEMQLFDLECLHQLAAMAARNGVGMVPQSPFATYYNALLRACGGRGSDGHESVKSQVAQALGSSDHRLQRGMDRQVQRRVAAEVVAVFPLTALVNHACRPNAQICSDFVDAHIDLQLHRDVEQGEEITISYIGYGRGVGHKNRDRRQLELQRKYLFQCACEACDPAT